MEDTKTTEYLFTGMLNEFLMEITAVLSGRDRTKLSQPERRVLIRTNFAAIEAMIYVMKQIAVAGHPDPACQTLTQAEKAFAHEQEYKLTEAGNVEARPAKIPLAANVRFAFKLFAKACSISSVPDMAGPQWQIFQRAIKVRDRITHPKKLSDLTISDEEVNGVAAAVYWLVASWKKLGDEVQLKAQSKSISSDPPGLEEPAL